MSDCFSRRLATQLKWCVTRAHELLRLRKLDIGNEEEALLLCFRRPFAG